MRGLWAAIGRATFWLAWPIGYLYLHNSKRNRVIVVSLGKVLVIKNWLGPGEWGLPGGGKKGRESSVDSAVRELNEEVGLNLKQSNLKLILSDTKLSQYGFSFLVDLFVCELPTTATLNRRRWEITRAEWIPIKELLSDSQLSTSSKDLIETWLEKEHLLD